MFLNTSIGPTKAQIHYEKQTLLQKDNWQFSSSLGSTGKKNKAFSPFVSTHPLLNSCISIAFTGSLYVPQISGKCKMQKVSLGVIGHFAAEVPDGQMPNTSF